MTWLSQHKYLLIACILILGILGFFTLTLKAQWVVDNISVKGKTSDQELFQAFNKNGGIFTKLTLPRKDPNRLNILLIGMRGLDVSSFNQGPGDLLTDTLLLVSLDKTTGKAALISLPRDLYITLPYEQKKRKINEVYTVGYDTGGEKVAFGLTKAVFSQVTGVYIDWIVRIDFAGFRRLIDTVGGLDIYLDKPFVEIMQWQGVGGFRLPSGLNHLNGEQALFYVRSRFSTSDFDRARRQQELMLVLKNKVTNLGILSNPVKIYDILDIIGNHVKTDADIDIPQGIALANQIDYHTIIHLVLSTDNYLYHATAPNGAYILLPQGDTFNKIHNAIVNIFAESSSKPL